MFKDNRDENVTISSSRLSFFLSVPFILRAFKGLSLFALYPSINISDDGRSVVCCCAVLFVACLLCCAVLCCSLFCFVVLLRSSACVFVLLPLHTAVFAAAAAASAAISFPPKNMDVPFFRIYPSLIVGTNVRSISNISPGWH